MAQHFSRAARPVYGSVNIDLLSAATQQPVTSIAQATPNDGDFSWTIPASVAEGNYIIRVTANEGVKASDLSDTPFSIVNGGKEYYVNDASTTGDVFTTAIGNNANSGKRPDQPMASLRALLAAYDLDLGDVIHVDAGTYRLYRNLTLDTQDSGVSD